WADILDQKRKSAVAMVSHSLGPRKRSSGRTIRLVCTGQKAHGASNQITQSREAKSRSYVFNMVCLRGNSDGSFKLHCVSAVLLVKHCCIFWKPGSTTSFFALVV